jgi:hypothetical protein
VLHIRILREANVASGAPTVTILFVSLSAAHYNLESDWADAGTKVILRHCPICVQDSIVGHPDINAALVGRQQGKGDRLRRKRIGCDADALLGGFDGLENKRLSAAVRGERRLNFGGS